GVLSDSKATQSKVRDPFFGLSFFRRNKYMHGKFPNNGNPFRPGRDRPAGAGEDLGEGDLKDVKADHGQGHSRVAGG
ncbi:MAG: hypothetical protein ACQEUH_14395, partial [Pseudomonadota bacterium]